MRVRFGSCDDSLGADVSAFTAARARNTIWHRRFPRHRLRRRARCAL